jgi:Phospholipase_D-nuclease N-terminal
MHTLSGEALESEIIARSGGVNALSGTSLETVPKEIVALSEVLPSQPTTVLPLVGTSSNFSGDNTKMIFTKISDILHISLSIREQIGGVFSKIPVSFTSYLNNDTFRHIQNSIGIYIDAALNTLEKFSPAYATIIAWSIIGFITLLSLWMFLHAILRPISWKIFWIVSMLLLPILGVVLYFFCSYIWHKRANHVSTNQAAVVAGSSLGAIQDMSQLDPFSHFTAEDNSIV